MNLYVWTATLHRTSLRTMQTYQLCEIFISHYMDASKHSVDANKNKSVVVTVNVPSSSIVGPRQQPNSRNSTRAVREKISKVAPSRIC